MRERISLVDSLGSRFHKDSLKTLPRIDIQDFFEYCDIRGQWLKRYAGLKSICPRYSAKAAKDVLQAHRALLLGRVLDDKSSSDISDYFSFWSSVFRDRDMGVNQDHLWSEGILLSEVSLSQIQEIWRVYWTISCHRYRATDKEAFADVFFGVHGSAAELIFNNSSAIYTDLPDMLSESKNGSSLFTPICIHDAGVDVELIRKVFPRIMPDGKSFELDIIPIDFNYRFVNRTPTDREFLDVLAAHPTFGGRGKEARIDGNIESTKAWIKENFRRSRNDNHYPILWFLPGLADEIGGNTSPRDNAQWGAVVQYAQDFFPESTIPVYEWRESVGTIVERAAAATVEIDRTIVEGFTDDEVRKMLASVEFTPYPTFVENEDFENKYRGQKTSQSIPLRNFIVNNGRILAAAA